MEGAKLGACTRALVVLDTSGAIKAMVGGKSYAKSQFNRVTKAKRQPGSAFKPFVYLAAIEQGFTPTSVEMDEPMRIGDWEPENYKQKYLGPVTLSKRTGAVAQHGGCQAGRTRCGPKRSWRSRIGSALRRELGQQCLDRARHLGSDTARTDLRFCALRQWRHAGRALSRHAHHHRDRPGTL